MGSKSNIATTILSERHEQRFNSILADVCPTQLGLPCDKIESGQYDDKKSYRDLGYDSLDLVDIVIRLEREFGISIKDSEIVESVTIADLKKLVAVAIKP